MTKVDVDQMSADNAQRLLKQVVPLELKAGLQGVPGYQQQQAACEDEYRATDKSYPGGSEHSLASNVQLVRFGPPREEGRALALIVIKADLIWRCALGLVSESQALFAFLLRRANALRQCEAVLVRATDNCDGWRYCEKQSCSSLHYGAWVLILSRKPFSALTHH